MDQDIVLADDNSTNIPTVTDVTDTPNSINYTITQTSTMPDKLTLGLGISVGIFSIISFITAIVSFFHIAALVGDNTDFTPAQIDTLKSWTTKMAFDTQNYLTAAGFADLSTTFVAAAGNITANTLQTSTSLLVNNTILITGDALKNNYITQIIPGQITIPDLTAVSASTNNLNTTSISSGTWLGNTIPTTKGGTGFTTTTPYAIVISGTGDVGTGTTNDFLISQGAGAVPIYQTFPVYANGQFNASFSSTFPLAWTLSASPVCFYVRVGNIYSVQGSVSLQAVTDGPLTGPQVTFTLIGNPSALIVVKGIWTLTNITQGYQVPMQMYYNHLKSLLTPITGFNAGDVFQCVFNMSYSV